MSHFICLWEQLQLDWINHVNLAFEMLVPLKFSFSYKVELNRGVNCECNRKNIYIMFLLYFWACCNPITFKHLPDVCCYSIGNICYVKVIT